MDAYVVEGGKLRGLRAERVTSVDVARRAGVSQSTVSLVFSGKAPGRISARTEAIVREAAHALGYRPNAAARALRARLGCAGLAPLEDWRGRPDSAGRLLRATQIAIADQAAAAADLVRGKDTAEPAVRIRGLERHVLPDDGPGAAALLRPPDEDLFA